ncbi:MAG: integrase arm-type DNA-binding domain-containing protein, partial [Rhodocyclaceae bacterium]|nr:integrase arm-type DNA-binding domain-containing protein [Rhodocyclaceae bacterium]
MPLTDAAIRTAKPTDKPQRLFDSGGLYLEVAPAGGKWWRFKYRFGGKEKRLSLGVYPDIGLKQARERRDAARKLLANGVDPGVVRKAERASRVAQAGNTFEAIAREWMATRGKEWTESYAGKTVSALERHAFPAIGAKPLVEVDAPMLLAMLRAIETRGTVDMAHRVQQHCGAVFRFAVATGRATNDPTPSLKGALSTVEQEHFAALTDPRDFAQLLRDVDD